MYEFHTEIVTGPIAVHRTFIPRAMVLEAHAHEHAAHLAKMRWGRYRIRRGDLVVVTSLLDDIPQSYCILEGNKHIRDDAGEVARAIRGEMLYRARAHNAEKLDDNVVDLHEHLASKT